MDIVTLYSIQKDIFNYIYNLKIKNKLKIPILSLSFLIFILK